MTSLNSNEFGTFIETTLFAGHGHIGISVDGTTTAKKIGFWKTSFGVLYLAKYPRTVVEQCQYLTATDFCKEFGIPRGRVVLFTEGKPGYRMERLLITHLKKKAM
jgi:hypothetical protein